MHCVPRHSMEYFTLATCRWKTIPSAARLSCRVKLSPNHRTASPTSINATFTNNIQNAIHTISNCNCSICKHFESRGRHQESACGTAGCSNIPASTCLLHGDSTNPAQKKPLSLIIIDNCWLTLLARYMTYYPQYT